ncbi:hypothetical protein [Anaerocolumna sp.]|uniref:hypothetical protein n=1 Tax=Anaerocolumna sp. TaxID=2041569 RepID=UPI0028A6C695|nr:hypothetical protein [Anaerocolumna sp.]
MNEFLNSSDKPSDWPANNREFVLEKIYRATEMFKVNPGYRTKEILLSLVSEHDLNQRSYEGIYRVTEFEVELINILYLTGAAYQINSLRVYLYEIVGDTTRMQKMVSWFAPALGGNNLISDTLAVKSYDNLLILPLKLYHYAYQKYNVEKDKSFSDQIVELINNMLETDSSDLMVSSLTQAYISMLNDLSYMHGTKRDNIWKFSRKELTKLFVLEAKLIKMNHQSPIVRPLKGVLMTQISNYILKSRNNYNEDYICKYISPETAKLSCRNHQIWMQKTKYLNDEREQKVIPELFDDDSWINYSWIRNIYFTATRTYYVSSFSKSIENERMKEEYGSCIYGFKDDRLVELLGPIGIFQMKKREDADPKLPDKSTRPYVSQVLAFDILYDKEQAKEELQYLFSIIDTFDMSNEDKKQFLEAVLQYWILSVKDPKWSYEKERRYVLFLYDDYDYREVEIDEKFLKMKTSLFLTPDFILGKNPVRWEIQHQVDAKRKFLSLKDYLFCIGCLMRDYDTVLEKTDTCPICGVHKLENVHIRDNSNLDN